MYFSKTLLTVIKPLGWAYLFWQYRSSSLNKFKEIINLTYCVLTKGKRILVVYTKNHPRMNSIAENSPEGIVFVRLTYPFKRNRFLDSLASKIDIVYEDGPTNFSLKTDQPVVKEYEHHHWGQHRLEDKQIKKIFVMSNWANPNFPNSEQKVEVLYPALPAIKHHKEKSRDSKNLTFFMAGSGAGCKGADIIFRAFENLEQKFAGRYQLNLVMASNYRRNYDFFPVNEACLTRTRQAHEKSLSKKNVYFSPMYPPCIVNYFYRNSDIYVIPTRYDSLPFSVLEAISYGLPIVTTNITSIPELVEHGKNGFLIDVRDFDVQSLAYYDYASQELEKYLTILIENADLRLSMAEESKRRVENKFNLDYKKNRLKTLFEEIIREKKNVNIK